MDELEDIRAVYRGSEAAVYSLLTRQYMPRLSKKNLPDDILKSVGSAPIPDANGLDVALTALRYLSAHIGFQLHGGPDCADEERRKEIEEEEVQNPLLRLAWMDYRSQFFRQLDVARWEVLGSMLGEPAEERDASFMVLMESDEMYKTIRKRDEFLLYAPVVLTRGRDGSTPWNAVRVHDLEDLARRSLIRYDGTGDLGAAISDLFGVFGDGQQSYMLRPNRPPVIRVHYTPRDGVVKAYRDLAQVSFTQYVANPEDDEHKRWEVDTESKCFYNLVMAVQLRVSSAKTSRDRLDRFRLWTVAGDALPMPITGVYTDAEFRVGEGEAMLYYVLAPDRDSGGAATQELAYRQPHLERKYRAMKGTLKPASTSAVGPNNGTDVPAGDMRQAERPDRGRTGIPPGPRTQGEDLAQRHLPPNTPRGPSRGAVGNLSRHAVTRGASGSQAARGRGLYRGRGVSVDTDEDVAKRRLEKLASEQKMREEEEVRVGLLPEEQKRQEEVLALALGRVKGSAKEMEEMIPVVEVRLARVMVGPVDRLDDEVFQYLEAWYEAKKKAEEEKGGDEDDDKGKEKEEEEAVGKAGGHPAEAEEDYIYPKAEDHNAVEARAAMFADLLPGRKYFDSCGPFEFVFPRAVNFGLCVASPDLLDEKLCRVSKLLGGPGLDIIFSVRYRRRADGTWGEVCFLDWSQRCREPDHIYFKRQQMLPADVAGLARRLEARLAGRLPAMLSVASLYVRIQKRLAEVKAQEEAERAEAERMEGERQRRLLLLDAQRRVMWQLAPKVAQKAVAGCTDPEQRMEVLCQWVLTAGGEALGPLPLFSVADRRRAADGHSRVFCAEVVRAEVDRKGVPFSQRLATVADVVARDNKQWDILLPRADRLGIVEEILLAEKESKAGKKAFRNQVLQIERCLADWRADLEAELREKEETFDSHGEGGEGEYDDEEEYEYEEGEYPGEEEYDAGVYRGDDGEDPGLPTDRPSASGSWEGNYW
ncbi:hypothetical protein DL762_000273 [Monosporascus cannonballus]|uniref:Uncharacterized protein n=1 Tax=Monosporascus cannonballus TaxID=155416 RepID=A0ABY0HJR5_9PEZI|nr:hypothetical protein DL762_000273 [Monosporascus cannonballus]